MLSQIVTFTLAFFALFAGIAGDSGEALRLDDDCAASGGEESGCAMHAMQVRARSVTSADAQGEAVTELRAAVRSDAAEASEKGAVLKEDPCDASPVSRMVKAAAPECIAQCPEVCSIAIPMAVAEEGAEAGASRVVAACGFQEQIGCVAELSSPGEACHPLTDFAAQWGLPPMPTSRAELASACANVTAKAPKATALKEDVGSPKGNGESARQALLQRAGRAADMAFLHVSLDEAVAKKEPDPRCENAGEGQLCTSKNTLIYCSAKKRLWGPGFCERREGRMSLCRSDGIGLQKGYCDDPFCRNGGAFGGPGYYCHKGDVVLCDANGGPPRVKHRCSDDSHTDYNGCRVTVRRSCHGGFPYPQCGVDSHDVDHSTCRRD